MKVVSPKQSSKTQNSGQVLNGVGKASSQLNTSQSMGSSRINQVDRKLRNKLRVEHVWVSLHCEWLCDGCASSGSLATSSVVQTAVIANRLHC